MINSRRSVGLLAATACLTLSSRVSNPRWEARDYRRLTRTFDVSRRV